MTQIENDTMRQLRLIGGGILEFLTIIWGFALFGIFVACEALIAITICDLASRIIGTSETLTFIGFGLWTLMVVPTFMIGAGCVASQDYADSVSVTRIIGGIIVRGFRWRSR